MPEPKSKNIGKNTNEDNVDVAPSESDSINPIPHAAIHIYEVRPRKDKLGVNLVSDVLPFGHLWYGGPNAANNAIAYPKFFGRSHNAVIRVYDNAGNVIGSAAVAPTPQTIDLSHLPDQPKLATSPNGSPSVVPKAKPVVP